MMPWVAHLVLLLAAMSWGASNIAQKTVLFDLGPLYATGISSFIGAAILSPIAARENKGSRPFAAYRKSSGMVLATILFSAAVLASQIGFGGTSVTNAGFLINFAAAVTPLSAWIVLREWPSPLCWPSIGLGLAGAWLMAGGSLSALAWGDLVCLLSAVFYSFSIPLVSRVVSVHGRPACLTCIQFLFLGTLCTLLAAVIEPFSLDRLCNAGPELVTLGVLSKGLPFFLMAWAQRHTTPTAVAIITSAEAVFGALFAMLFLDETMSSLSMLGALLISLGIVIIQLPDPSVALQRRRHRVVVTLVSVERPPQRDIMSGGSPST